MTVDIDLGTTYSLCAIFVDGQPKLIPNSHGEVLTPSVVGGLESGEIVVGAAARELRGPWSAKACRDCFVLRIRKSFSPSLQPATAIRTLNESNRKAIDLERDGAFSGN